MDIFADYSNPIGYDQRLIMDKLGYDTPGAVEKPNNVNDRLRVALLEHELAESRRKLADVDISKKQLPVRETLSSGKCESCSSKNSDIEGMRSRNLDYGDGETIMGLNMKQFLIVMIVIIAAFCVIQYFSHQTEMRELMSAMCLMLKDSGRGVQVAPQTQAVPQTQAIPQTQAVPQTQAAPQTQA